MVLVLVLVLVMVQVIVMARSDLTHKGKTPKLT
jgi:hypothetical protein